MILKNKVGQEYSSVLYKYKGLFSHLKSLILTGTIYLPTGKMLNDPFDGRAIFSDNFFEGFRISHIEGLDNRFLKESVRAATSTYEYKIASSFKLNESIQNTITVFSLSATKNHKLLWSYYARSYKGYCLEFDFQHDLKTESPITQRIYKVNYDLEGDMIEMNSVSDIEKLFTTKSRIWGHEKEYRVLTSTEAKTPLDEIINPKALQTIYFGFKVLDDCVNYFRKLCDENGFKHVRIVHLYLSVDGIKEKEI